MLSICGCSDSRRSVLSVVVFPPALQLRRDKQHLESELERAERESATYVTEVREVKKEFCYDDHTTGGHQSELSVPNLIDYL